MEAKELREVLKQREKRTLEYKRAWDNVPGNLFETICAFLNREGGLIVLGAEDNGEIKKGVSPNAAYQMCRDISNMSNNPQKLSPTFLLQPEEVEIDGKKVIVVYVPCSSQVHSTAGKVYDRSLDGDYVLKTDAEISAAYLRKSQAYSENKVYPYMRMEHLQEKTIRKAKKLIKEMYPKHPWLKLSTMEMLKQANLYREDLSGGEGGFSLAALMLFGKQEASTGRKPGSDDGSDFGSDFGSDNIIINDTETAESIGALLHASKRTIYRESDALQTIGLLRRKGEHGGKWIVLVPKDVSQ